MAIEMNSMKLLEDLVAIRSDKHAQPEVGKFEYGIAQYLKQYIERTYPHLTIEEQKIAPGRANLFVHDGEPPRLLFAGHMDCVEEGAGWTKNVRGERQGGRFYGRGAADMKAGIVAILAALDHAQKQHVKGVAALFYADEEYDFLGMKKFVKAYADRFKPELVVCPEVTHEQLIRGGRGIIEFRTVLRGKTGHAAHVNKGINALDGFLLGIDALKEYLSHHQDELLGSPTLNIALLQSGAYQRQGKEGTGPVFGQMGNVVPDYCEAIVEIRTVPSMQYDEVIEAFRSGVRKHRTVIDSLKTTLNLGSFATDRSHLNVVESIQEEVLGKVSYFPITEFGYSDTQMMAEAWGVPTIVWGPEGKNMHGADEYVEIASLERLEQSFRLLIDRWK